MTYYEFHRNRAEIFERIKAEVLEGRYRPKIPVTLRAEKKAGLTRRVCIPAVEDAVVLQAAEVVVAWKLPPRGQLLKEVCQLARNFGRERFARRSEMFFLEGIWLLAKYGSQQELQAHILLSKKTWSVSSGIMYLTERRDGVTTRETGQR